MSNYCSPLAESVACGLVALTLLGVAGCGSNSSATSVENESTFATTLDSRSRPVDERLAEVEQLGRQGSFDDAPTVIHALDDASPQVRKAAAVAVQCHSVRARPGC